MMLNRKCRAIFSRSARAESPVIDPAATAMFNDLLDHFASDEREPALRADH